MTDRDFEAEIAQIKAAHDAATRARVRAEHERDTAAAKAQAIRTQLQNDYGVETAEQAQTLLAQYHAELTDTIARLREQLREAGGAV